jgi:hypothetical protein
MPSRGIIAAHHRIHPNIAAPRPARECIQRCFSTRHGQPEDDMATFNGNSKVNGGYYFSMKALKVEVIGEEGGTLPGPAEARYLSVPFPLLFVLTPVIGLAFLMFLPLIGFILLAQALALKISGRVYREAGALAASVGPAQAHGAAYLGGKEGEAPAEKVSPELEQLEKDVEARRNAQK